MSNMNDQQLEAVMSAASKILVLAGAGTGKTYVMINRIKRLVDEGADPVSILALTFTNAAAFEMKERYHKFQEDKSKGCPEFKTFHAFCYSLLVKDIAVRKALGYSTIPSIVDESTMKRTIKEVKQQCNVTLSDKQLENPDTVPSSKKFEYDMFHKAMKQRLLKDSIITFDMLADSVCSLFIKNDPLIQTYIDQYKYIFIDEFQDTDPLQWKFAQCFKDANIFIVGDALQSIYSFRNADSSIIKSLAYDDDWNCVKLFENYRSTTDIVEFANKHSTYADSKYRVSLHAQRDGVPVDTLSIYREKRGEKYPRNILSESAVYCIDHEGTSAILCRTNAEVSEVTDFLEDNDILYSTGKSNEDAIHILRSVTDGSYMINWLASYLNADKYANFLRIEILEAIEDEAPLDKVKRFHEHFGSNPKIHKSIDDVFAIRKILTEDELPFIKCNKILELLNVKGVTVDTNATTAVEILNYLIEAIKDKASNDLYVGTIHSSKGLEYDSVVLLGVNGPSFHLKDEENKNLYYVGITRARTNLMVVEG